MLKRVMKWLARTLGYEIHKIPHAVSADIPQSELYRPLFSPWLGTGDFSFYYTIASSKTLVSIDRCYVIYTMLLQSINIDGDIWECGVYKGGTAAMMASILKRRGADKKLFLFDTFAGMPATDPDKDIHRQGDFADTTLAEVRRYVGHEDLCVFCQGFIPDTFAGLDSARIAFAHIDVDIYSAIKDSLDFIWPRLSLGGILIFDDYGFPSCPGARAAVDEFFRGLNCVPLCLPTGQALVFKALA